MKHKHVAIGLIALSIIALAFVSTAAAQTEYFPLATVDNHANKINITIDTTSDIFDGSFNGLLVDPSSIVITLYLTSGAVVTIVPGQHVSVSLSQNSIVIVINYHPMFDKKDWPISGTAFNVVGNIGAEGDTFFATGPGWTWTGHT